MGDSTENHPRECTDLIYSFIDSKVKIGVIPKLSNFVHDHSTRIIKLDEEVVAINEIKELWTERFSLCVKKRGVKQFELDASATNWEKIAVDKAKVMVAHANLSATLILEKTVVRQNLSAMRLLEKNTQGTTHDTGSTSGIIATGDGLGAPSSTSTIKNDHVSKRKSKENQNDKPASKKSCHIGASEEVEEDGFIIPGKADTLGTIIKKEALKLHDQFKKGKVLSPADRKVMSNGLSSIVDMVDERADGQRRFLTVEQWDYVKNLFSHLKIAPPNKVESAVDIWKIVYKTCEAIGSVKVGEQYLFKMRQREDSSEESRLICKAMEHMLELVETKQDILCQRGSKYTENDYLRIVWSPILERIFSSPLRLISGESIFKYTTKQKQQLYDESNDVKGFKIDIRYVVDKNGKTYDLGAAELGKDGASCKIIQDEGKLTREGKDVVDSLLKTLHESNHRHVLSWIIQIDACEAEISTLHIVGNGVYVAYPQFKFELPTTLDNLSKFEQALQAFLTIKEHMMMIQSRLSTEQQREGVISQTFNRSNQVKSDDISTWTRATWYTPPKPSKSRVPVPLFGQKSKFNFAERLLVARNQDLIESEEEKENVDMFGWTKRNGKFYNIHTQKYADEHPLDKESQVIL